MRKHAIVTMALAIALAVPVITPAAEAPQSEATTESEGKEYTFRGIPWGSSLEEVKNSDFLKKHPDYEYEKSLNVIGVDNITVANKSTMAVLYFGDSGLYQAVYVLEEKHANLNSYIDDFDDIYEVLKKKYGEPDKTIDDWKDDLYKDDPSDYGMAVAAEHAAFYRKWNGENSDIILICNGDNFEISNLIVYESPSLAPAETEDSGL